jgi:hypothetical protein
VQWAVQTQIREETIGMDEHDRYIMQRMLA